MGCCGPAVGLDPLLFYQNERLVGIGMTTGPVDLLGERLAVVGERPGFASEERPGFLLLARLEYQGVAFPFDDGCELIAFPIFRSHRRSISDEVLGVWSGLAVAVVEDGCLCQLRVLMLDFV